MTWHRTTDVEQYLAAVGDLLLSEPWRHSVALTVVEDVRATPDGTVFAWWDEGGGDVTGAVSQTPPYALLLSVVPDHAVGPLVELLAPERVNGPTALAAQVAAVAARAAGGTAVLRSAQRLHRLAALVEPDAPGAARIAGPKDLDLVVDWFRAFVEETGVTAGAVEDRVRERLALDGYVLWEDDAPVAMAGRTRRAFGTVRVGPVWTPPEHRGRGYGAAVTAAVTGLSCDQGATDVVLFTDLTNPTSNALYARLGFRPAGDHAELRVAISSV
jgi:ribosomal protein S18 acetylase RimI-like enzyme